MKLTLNQVGKYMQVTSAKIYCKQCLDTSPWVDKLQPPLLYGDLVAEDEEMQLASEPQSPPPVSYSAGDAAAGQQAGAVDPNAPSLAIGEDLANGFSTTTSIGGVSGISEIESPDRAAATSSALMLPVPQADAEMQADAESKAAFRAQLTESAAAGNEWAGNHPAMDEL